MSMQRAACSMRRSEGIGLHDLLSDNFSYRTLKTPKPGSLGVAIVVTEEPPLPDGMLAPARDVATTQMLSGAR